MNESNLDQLPVTLLAQILMYLDVQDQYNLCSSHPKLLARCADALPFTNLDNLEFLIAKIAKSDEQFMYRLCFNRDDPNLKSRKICRYLVPQFKHLRPTSNENENLAKQLANVSDRELVMRCMRNLDVFSYCYKTLQKYAPNMADHLENVASKFKGQLWNLLWQRALIVAGDPSIPLERHSRNIEYPARYPYSYYIHHTTFLIPVRKNWQYRNYVSMVAPVRGEKPELSFFASDVDRIVYHVGDIPKATLSYRPLEWFQTRYSSFPILPTSVVRAFNAILDRHSKPYLISVRHDVRIDNVFLLMVFPLGNITIDRQQVKRFEQINGIPDERRSEKTFREKSYFPALDDKHFYSDLLEFFQKWFYNNIFSLDILHSFPSPQPTQEFDSSDEEVFENTTFPFVKAFLDIDEDFSSGDDDKTSSDGDDETISEDDDETMSQ